MSLAWADAEPALYRLVAAQAELWQSTANRLAMGGVFVPIEIYFQAASAPHEWGSISFGWFSDPFDWTGWERVGEISSASTRAQAVEQLRKVVWKLPILPSA